MNVAVELHEYGKIEDLEGTGFELERTMGLKALGIAFYVGSVPKDKFAALKAHPSVFEIFDNELKQLI